MKTIVFFHSVAAKEQTSVLYHLAHMLPRMGCPTIVVDVDPQASLTAAFFSEERLESLSGDGDRTIVSCLDSSLQGVHDTREPDPEAVADDLWLIPGHIGLSRFEEPLSRAWAAADGGGPAFWKAAGAIHRIARRAGERVQAAIVLLDTGPNLSAINRSALLAADAWVIPIAADLISLQGLKIVGPTVREWRDQWKRTLGKNSGDADVPSWDMRPSGYVVLLRPIRHYRPDPPYFKWLNQVPRVYREAVLGESGVGEESAGSVVHDENWIFTIRDFVSISSMAEESRKPMYDLGPAEGALGSLLDLVRTSEAAFRALAERIIARVGIRKP